VFSKKVDPNTTFGRLRTAFAQDFKVGVGDVRLFVQRRVIDDREIIGQGKKLAVTVEAPGLILTYRRPDGSMSKSRPLFPYTTIGLLERATDEGHAFSFWQNGVRMDSRQKICHLSSLVIDLRPLI
jgi:hypothetical protein